MDTTTLLTVLGMVGGIGGFAAVVVKWMMSELTESRKQMASVVENNTSALSTFCTQTEDCPGRKQRRSK